jgi:arylformamidase
MEAWRAYSRAELDRQYSPSSRVPSLQVYLDEYADRSRAARSQLKHRSLRYGPGPDDWLDHFLGPDAPGPLIVFVHGGNWQALGREDSAFAAPDAIAAGASFVAIDYGLAPATKLPEMVDAVRRGLRWLVGQAPTLGFDPARVFLAGSSAGAHLAACALEPWVAGGILLSGMYDLEPVRHCYVNDALGLDAATAQAFSPLRQPLTTPIILARGENETEEYARQHAEMALHAQGSDLVVEGRNHFDLPYDLIAPGTALGEAVLGMVQAKVR